MIRLVRDTRADMRVDQVGHPEMRHQAIEGRKISSNLNF
jgi:hypothetical protein